MYIFLASTLHKRNNFKRVFLEQNWCCSSRSQVFALMAKEKIMNFLIVFGFRVLILNKVASSGSYCGRSDLR